MKGVVRGKKNMKPNLGKQGKLGCCLGKKKTKGGGAG